MVRTLNPGLKGKELKTASSMELVVGNRSDDSEDEVCDVNTSKFGDKVSEHAAKVSAYGDKAAVYGDKCRRFMITQTARWHWFIESSVKGPDVLKRVVFLASLSFVSLVTFMLFASLLTKGKNTGHQDMDDNGFDHMVTDAVLVQLFAMFSLLRHLKAHGAEAANAIDGTTLVMLAAAFFGTAFPLAYQRNGWFDPNGFCYIPQHIGGSLCMPLGFLTVGVTCWTFFQWLKLKSTPLTTKPAMIAMGAFFVASWVFGTKFHYTCDEKWVDIVWSAANWLQTFALLPQFYKLQQDGSCSKTVGTFLALMYLSRMLTGFFYGINCAFHESFYQSLASEAVIAAWHGGCVGTLLSHLVAYLLCGDFLWVYFAAYNKDKIDTDDAPAVAIPALKHALKKAGSFFMHDV